MKKFFYVFILITVITLSIVLFIYITLDGGIRSFNYSSPEEAINQSGEHDFIFATSNRLIEPIFINANNKEYCLLIHGFNNNNTMYLSFYQTKNDKYAYVYNYSFTDSEITEETSELFYDIYGRCDIVVGVIPGNMENITINETLEPTIINVTFNDNQYKYWYICIDGGYDSIKSIDVV